MKDLLELYELKKDEGDIYQYNFNCYIGEGELEKIDDYFGGLLPKDYRFFLENFNGGFICDGHWGEYIWETHSRSLPRSRSINFHSADELLEYTFITESMKQQFEDFPLVIPIAVSPKEQQLVMWADENSQVFIYEPEWNWPLTEIYPDLRSFLKEYIDNEGYIENLF